MQLHPRTWALSLILASAISGCTTAAQTAQNSWFEIKTPRFAVYTDGDPEQARALALDLERFHQVAMAKTNAEDREAAPPLRVFLAKDAASFNSLTGAAAKVEGLFKSTYRGNYAIAESQILDERKGPQASSRQILFHEYMHYIQALKGARVPSWYNEGLAEYMATTEFREDGYTLGCPPVDRTRWSAHMRWLPVRKVLAAENIGAAMRHGADSYLQSWYMVHYFTADGERQKALREYLRLWTGGVPVEQAIQSAFGQDADELDKLLRAYAASEGFECASITTTSLKTPEATAKPLSTSEAHYYVGDLVLAMFGPTDTALELLGTANKGGSDARVLRALARAHWQKTESAEGDAVQVELDQAQKFLAQAQKLEPAHPEALALEGHLERVRAGRLAADEKSRKETVKRARSAYRKAIKADETIAEAYFGLGLTYLIDDNGSEEARASLEVAAFLLPLETTIALVLGKILVERGSVLEAIPALEYVLHMSADAGQREQARAVLAELRKRAAAGDDAAQSPESSPEP